MSTDSTSGYVIYDGTDKKILVCGTISKIIDPLVFKKITAEIGEEPVLMTSTEFMAYLDEEEKKAPKSIDFPITCPPLPDYKGYANIVRNGPGKKQKGKHRRRW